MNKHAKHILKITLALCICIALVFGTLPAQNAQAAETLSTSAYAINRVTQIMYGVPLGTAPGSLTAKMDNNAASLSVHLPDGRTFTGNAVGTGMSIKLNAGEDALTIVVSGDVNGDGLLSITDYTLSRLSILGLKSLSGALRTAADVNGDGKITITDYTLMRLDILGLKTIVPNQNDLPLAGVTIGLDPGHQRVGNNELELISPTGTDTKKKVSYGTAGRYTRVAEYVVNLQVGLKLRDKLESLGAAVVMTRETHDVDISNAERAVMMNNVPVDCWLRIHANGNTNTDVHGMSVLVPTPGTMNTADLSIAADSAALARCLIDATAAETGAKNNGVVLRSDQTGFSWSSVPVCTIEMGFMSNYTEDHLLITSAYQDRIAEGLVDGFLQYFCPCVG